MSPTTSSSTTNFQLVFNAALEAYENKTKNKLLTHPLAAKLQPCNSPADVLSVLQELVQQFDQHRSSDERLRNWLNPTVNVLYAFSATIGEGVGLVGPKLQSPYNPWSDCHLSGILPCKSDLFRHRCPSPGKLPLDPLVQAIVTLASVRRLRMSTPTKMHLLISLSTSKAFSGGSSRIQKYRWLQQWQRRLWKS